MTDAELDALEKRARIWITEPMRRYADRDDAQRFEVDVLALIAEVRRLRSDPTMKMIETLRQHYPGETLHVVPQTSRLVAAERLAEAVDRMRDWMHLEHDLGVHRDEVGAGLAELEDALEAWRAAR